MLQLTSTITENATIEIGLRDIEVPKPGIFSNSGCEL